MMIVVVIVGILAAALFPSLIGYMSRSRDSARLLAIREISNALSSYSTDNDVYPNP
jgi:type II secretory pathway pseudopilin PulG